jgi:hypothetical protein
MCLPVFKVSIWSYNYEIKERSLELLNEIVNEVLEKCGLNKNWVNLEELNKIIDLP